MTYEHSLVTIDGGVMTVTFNRPERRNALNSAANHELGRIFDQFESDPKLRVCIVTGSGKQAFCAGGDLRAEAASDTPSVPTSGFAGLIARFRRRKPLIAAVNGAAMGGGFEAALACDVIIAAEHATFGLTEARVGLAALGGGVQRLIGEIGAKRAKSLLLTGRKITAQEAADMGLVAEVVPAEQVMEAARCWANEMMLCSPASLAATFAVADSLDGNSAERSIVEMMQLPEVQQLLSGPDAREGPRAFAEKRAPKWAKPS